MSRPRIVQIVAGGQGHVYALAADASVWEWAHWESGVRGWYWRQLDTWGPPPPELETPEQAAERELNEALL